MIDKNLSFASFAVFNSSFCSAIIAVRSFTKLERYIFFFLMALVLYKKKPIIITTGYAGVLSIETNKTLQHRLTKAKAYKLFKMNATNLDFSIINGKLITSHKLGLK